MGCEEFGEVSWKVTVQQKIKRKGDQSAVEEVKSIYLKKCNKPY